MGHRKFWPEDTDPHGRWGEFRGAHVAERGTRARRDRDPMDRGLRAEIPGGGYQRPRAEGWRAYDPGDLPRAGMTGQRGLRECAADEIAAPFDEDRVLERVDQDHRGRGPKGWRRSDQRIAEDVNDRLTDDPDVDASDVEVRVEDGEVTLSGTVDSRVARRRAENLAEDVRGVGHVQNNLRVRAVTRAPDAGHTMSPWTTTGHGGSLPSGAGADATATSGSGATGMAAGTGASAGGDPLLGSEETQGRRYAQAPVDR
ncbi:MAG TPA: BON domain-containing protein [Geminicoccaceae bacterium]|nr:BON domain-containing protein [Geminicoccaceae bacterium]